MAVDATRSVNTIATNPVWAADCESLAKDF